MLKVVLMLVEIPLSFMVVVWMIQIVLHCRIQLILILLVLDLVNLYGVGHKIIENMKDK